MTPETDWSRVARGAVAVLLLAVLSACNSSDDDDGGTSIRTTEEQVIVGHCRETTLARFPPLAEVQALLPASMTALTAQGFFTSISALPEQFADLPLDILGVAILATHECDEANGGLSRILAIILPVEPLTHPAIPDDGATTHFYIFKPGYAGRLLEAANAVGIDGFDVSASMASRDYMDVGGEKFLQSAVSVLADGEPYFDAVVGSAGGAIPMTINFHLWGMSDGGLIASQFIGEDPQAYIRDFESCLIAPGTDAELVFGECDPTDGAVQIEYLAATVSARYFPDYSIDELLPKE